MNLELTTFYSMRFRISVIFLTLSTLSLQSSNSFAAPQKTLNTHRGPQSDQATPEQKVDVDALKTQYWKNNGTPELNVVQNRIYTKAGKLNLQFNASSMNHDPFLTSYVAQFSLGVNITEYLGIHAVYWKFFEINSPAVDALLYAQLQSGGSLYSPNTNPLQNLIGGELSWSLLYGKLSLIGKAILHFDLFLLGGAGSMNSTNGNMIAPWVGFGQQVYLAQFLALRADFRYLFYQEKLIERNSVSSIGTVLNTRATSAPIFSVGLSFYLF